MHLFYRYSFLFLCQNNEFLPVKCILYKCNVISSQKSLIIFFTGWVLSTTVHQIQLKLKLRQKGLNAWMIYMEIINIYVFLILIKRHWWNSALMELWVYIRKVRNSRLKVSQFFFSTLFQSCWRNICIDMFLEIFKYTCTPLRLFPTPNKPKDAFIWFCVCRLYVYMSRCKILFCYIQ